MNNECKLLVRKCQACNEATEKLTHKQCLDLSKDISNWTLWCENSYIDNSYIDRHFKFKNFAEAMEFVNEVAELAEAEGHHPDIQIYEWKKVRLILTTHAIRSLSINDFILAAKIDLL